MKHYFYYGGVSSADFNTYILRAPQFDSPKRDTEQIRVPGKNGTLTLDNERFENKEHKIEVYTEGDIQANMESLRAWLTESSAYMELKDTYNPDIYYMARFTDEIKEDKSDHNGVTYTLRFDRMPQRFLESGRIPITVTENRIIRNKTRFEAKPLIRAYGTGSFTISDVTISITSADDYTDIDCGLEEAYKDTLQDSKNDCITLTSGRFPVFKKGDNNIRLLGISRLEITPRWWTI